MIVEGGRELITSFINKEMWDEMRVFKSEDLLKVGLSAPEFSADEFSKTKLENNTYFRYLNKK